MKHVIESLKEGYTEDDFVNMFKELYPKDWNKVVKRYEDHKRRTKPGKSFPMPKPQKYILNVSYKFRNAKK
ncbi:hypothetical protein COM96_06500 [Bacillus cereus]|uniref:Uncharacterized protein n=1 Tax=Bacillus cereus TaxID=1396 RepID=A0A2A7I0Z6_BACCE|nr:hypothetical protein COM96_06500 [Bacillus cereus]